MEDIDYMDMAIVEAKKSLESRDVPVGAVIVRDGQVLAMAHNQKEEKHSPIYHAEILAIDSACQKLNVDKLVGATIYTTKEPCLMCMGAILSARIDRVVFGAEDYRFGTKELGEDNKFNHKCNVVGGIREEECSRLLTDFFKNIR